MEMTNTVPGWYKVFGDESTGDTPQERAATSLVRFVRSQDELGIYNSSSTGRCFTAKEALLHFGSERLKQVFYDGSALLPPKPDEPAKTLRERREELGITQTDLAGFVGLKVDAIAKAESPDYTNSIHDLTRLAMVLSLDDATIGFQPGANGDQAIAVRLKAWRRTGATARTIASLSEITWVIATQQRLQRILTPYSKPLTGFVPNDYYGDAYNPVWKVASELAIETRRLLGISPNEPIESLRKLCRTLEVPLVHAQLTQTIAGATLATGDVRGIVVNVSGNDKNVWVQRATVAHELGHLLWDPAERLQALVVDERSQVEEIKRERQDVQNWSTQERQHWLNEARANAFAVELLAPQEAIRERTRTLDFSDYENIADAIRDNMEWFGLSATAMRYHLWNTFDRAFDLERVLSYLDLTPTDDWKGMESFTDDIFVFRETPISRRGYFAGLVAKAEQEGWLSEQAAAIYLNTDLSEYTKGRGEVIALYAA